MGRLENKVAIVTGGASNPSLGRSTSIAFAREGAKVVITDIDKDGGKKVESEINESNGKALFIEHDVTSLQDWEKVRKETLENFGKVDILVNNAGIAILHPLEETTEADWDKTIDVNLKSFFPLISLRLDAGRNSVLISSFSHIAVIIRIFKSQSFSALL